MSAHLCAFVWRQAERVRERMRFSWGSIGAERAAVLGARTHRLRLGRTSRGRSRSLLRLLVGAGALGRPIAAHSPHVKMSWPYVGWCGYQTFTGRACGSFSSSSDWDSSREVGTIGRSTTTPCAFIESRKMDSMAPWCNVIYGYAFQELWMQMQRTPKRTSKG